MSEGSRRGQGLHFDARTLELLRRFSWEGEKGETLYRALSLRPDLTVIDVGCGSGAFTRVLARKLDPNRGGRIIGVDRDPRLLGVARRITKDEGLDDRLVSFTEGDAQDLPFPENSADRVVCQAVLWLMNDEQRSRTLSEMIRVCKVGGIVAAVEGAIDTSISYIPSRPRLSELRAKEYAAQLQGYHRLYGYDRNIGVKLPALFHRLGLERVRLDGVADVRLRSDDRIPEQHKLEEGHHSESMNKALLSRIAAARSENESKTLIEQEEPALIAGGMVWEEVLELARLYDDYIGATLRSASEIATDDSVHGHVVFVTSGLKPKKTGKKREGRMPSSNLGCS